MFYFFRSAEETGGTAAHGGVAQSGDAKEEGDADQVCSLRILCCRLRRVLVIRTSSSLL